MWCNDIQYNAIKAWRKNVNCKTIQCNTIHCNEIQQ